MLVPRGIMEAELTGDPEKAVAHIDALSERGTDKLFLDRHVKLFTDGAFFSELMQMQGAGFIDGHQQQKVEKPDT